MVVKSDNKTVLRDYYHDQQVWAYLPQTKRKRLGADKSEKPKLRNKASIVFCNSFDEKLSCDNFIYVTFLSDVALKICF